MKPILVATLVPLGLTASIAMAVGPATADFNHPRALLVAQADETMTDGEVRKIDKDTKKITIKHAEIKNFSMPGMTMVFQVQDPALLDEVKQGDKVRFHVEQMNGALVVTRIEAVK
jgi:Cu(I)/Ag(I) efflux system periplasmic protein CusF